MLSRDDRVPIEEWANEFVYVTCLIPCREIGEGKPSLNRRISFNIINSMLSS